MATLNAHAICKMTIKMALTLCLLASICKAQEKTAEQVEIINYPGVDYAITRYHCKGSQKATLSKANGAVLKQGSVNCDTLSNGSINCIIISYDLVLGCLATLEFCRMFSGTLKDAADGSVINEDFCYQ